MQILQLPGTTSRITCQCSSNEFASHWRRWHRVCGTLSGSAWKETDVLQDWQLETLKDSSGWPLQGHPHHPGDRIHGTTDASCWRSGDLWPRRSHSESLLAHESLSCTENDQSDGYVHATKDHFNSHHQSELGLRCCLPGEYKYLFPLPLLKIWQILVQNARKWQPSWK